MIKNVLFDLDGTLLPMDQEKFVRYYLPMLAKRFAKKGIKPDTTIAAVWKGVEAMVLNDGSKVNEECFWQAFELYTGVPKKDVEEETMDFYANEFNDAIASTEPSPLAARVVKSFKEREKKVYLATNPIFPRIATLNRIRWAGLDAEDFEDITTYETCHYCKPNPEYFQEILDRFDLKPEECLMVGNDVDEDLSIRKLGVQTFLVTDCLENKKDRKYETEYEGSMEELLAFSKETF